MNPTLADRIRGVLNTPSSRAIAVTPTPTHPEALEEEAALGRAIPIGSAAGEDSTAGRRQPPDLESILGGEWRRQGDAHYFVVESRRERGSTHGRETVGALSDRLAASLEQAALVAGFAIPAPMMFFDLETTGLSGGAGTYAFLVGCASFDRDGAFVTRQFTVVRFSDERSVLGAVAGELARAGALVSFNGRSFDAPLLETRYLYHRLLWPIAELPHLDMLHVARRFWKRHEPGALESSCSLGALERHLLGHQRRGDVPGFEVPGRYFQFVRTGDARRLAAVFEHNRLDLLSLASLTARVLDLVRLGPQAARDSREALALGGVYARAGLDEAARHAFKQAAALAPSPALHIEALKSLALSARRARSFEEAAGYWRQILDVPGCPNAAAREANEALAIHHEHRARDLVAARTFARHSLEAGGRPAVTRAVEHRLARIERKIGERVNGLLNLEW